MNAFVAPAATGLSSFSRLSSSTCAVGAGPHRTAALFPRSKQVTRHAPMRASMMDEDTVEDGGAPVPDKKKLFVGNLAWGTTDETLREAFGRFGNVVDSRVVCDRFTGKSRGFGFIEYDEASCAEDALVGMNGVEVDGRNVRVDRANQRPAPRRQNYY